MKHLRLVTHADKIGAGAGDGGGASGVLDTSKMLAGQNVWRVQECYEQGLSSAQESARAFAEVVETVWGSNKLLHMRMLQNIAAHTNAFFGAARAITQANSLPEVAQLQGELWAQVLATASEQAREFFDLSSRASQHVMETAVSAATRPMTLGPDLSHSKV